MAAIKVTKFELELLEPGTPTVMEAAPAAHPHSHEHPHEPRETASAGKRGRE
jgi:hypothetical protein